MISFYITLKMSRKRGKRRTKMEKKVVFYEDFGAKGDGVTDDFIAFRDAHAYANENKLPVKAKEGATYYLHDTLVDGVVSSIRVCTDVDWTGAEIIIDDSDIDYFDGTRRACTHMFYVSSDYEKKIMTLDNEEDAKKLRALGSIGEKYGTTHIDLGLGYPAMLVIYNSNHEVYRRSGKAYEKRGSGNPGSAQHELIVVDENGKIDPSTPFMFDYEEITRVDIIRDDIKPITIKGTTVTTRACRVNARTYITQEDGTTVKRDASYYARGMCVNRSHTVVDGVRHVVVGEFTPDEHRAGFLGPHYAGFFSGLEANEITFKNCVMQGRRYYRIQGTYDLSGNLVNKITFDSCVQSNFWIDAEGNPAEWEKGDLSMRWNDINGTRIRHCWGVGGTNFCKNMTYINSKLSRFDAHCGLYNGKIIDSCLTFFAITGKGDFTVKNTHWYSTDNGNVDSPLIYMRGDYGCTWEGSVTLDNVTAHINDDFWIFMHAFSNWNYGYKCYIPNFEINNLRILKRATGEDVGPGYEIDVMNRYKDKYMHREKTYSTPLIRNINHTWTVLEDDFTNDNPTGKPEYIKITNNEAGYLFKLPYDDDPDSFFAETKFIYGEGEDEYYIGTAHENTKTFKFN